MIRRTDVKNLIRSFRYAFRGMAYCIKNERNMRIHIAAVVLLSYFAYFFRLERGEYLVLVLCFGIVISAEAFNTAIEALVNLESPSYHRYARIAKDVAAGAVAISAIAAAVAGVVMFFDPDRLLRTLILMFQTPWAGVLFVALILLGLFFVFNGSRLFGEHGTRIYHFKDEVDAEGVRRYPPHGDGEE